MGLTYKLIGGNFYVFPLEQVLENRGITKDLFNVDDNAVIDYNYIDNINKGAKLLLTHLNNNSKIALVVDSDVDGCTSSAIMYRYIKQIKPEANIKYFIHLNKEHGLSKDIVIDDDIDLVVLPDSSTNDYEQHKVLKDKGIDVLVIDHHEAEDGYSQNAVVINNQLSENYPNKQLSGVGVTYKFCKALDEILGLDFADSYLDLVALGNISDMVSMKSEETRYFVKEGLNNIVNPFLKALCEVYKYDLDGKLNISKVSWTIAPKINGVIRSGTHDDKVRLFEAFVSDDEVFCITMAQDCKAIKSKQDRDVKSAVPKLEKQIKEVNKCLILDGNKLNANYRGLIAGKLSDKYGVPVLIYSDMDGEYVGGSFRGCNFTDTFKDDLESSRLMDMVVGHQGAGGWSAKKKDLDNIKDYLNWYYKDKEIRLGKEHEVDFELEGSQVTNEFVNVLGSYEDEFGGDIQLPMIAVKNIGLTFADVKITKTNIIFEYNGIKYIKKFATKILKEEFQNRTIINLDLVGKVTYDTLGNKGQVEIVDIDIKG